MLGEYLGGVSINIAEKTNQPLHSIAKLGDGEIIKWHKHFIQIAKQEREALKKMKQEANNAR